MVPLTIGWHKFQALAQVQSNYPSMVRSFFAPVSPMPIREVCPTLMIVLVRRAMDRTVFDTQDRCFLYTSVSRALRVCLRRNKQA